jgi:hypothetical protein
MELTTKDLEVFGIGEYDCWEGRAVGRRKA